MPMMGAVQQREGGKQCIFDISKKEAQRANQQGQINRMQQINRGRLPSYCKLLIKRMNHSRMNQVRVKLMGKNQTTSERCTVLPCSFLKNSFEFICLYVCNYVRPVLSRRVYTRRVYTRLLYTCYQSGPLWLTNTGILIDW